MTNSYKIVAFLSGGKPGAFCDDCIKVGLNLPRRQQVAAVTLALSSGGGFRREPGACAAKNHTGRSEKLVTRVL